MYLRTYLGYILLDFFTWRSLSRLSSSARLLSASLPGWGSLEKKVVLEISKSVSETFFIHEWKKNSLTYLEEETFFLILEHSLTSGLKSN